MFVEVQRKNRYGEFKAMLVKTEEIVAVIEKTRNKFDENGAEIDATNLEKEYVIQLKNGYSHVINAASYDLLLTKF